MESMHRALLDGESGEIVRRIYVKEKNVGCLQCLSPCSFCVKIFWSGTVTRRSLHVNSKSLSTSFDSIYKTIQIESDSFSYGPV